MADEYIRKPILRLSVSTTMLTSETDLFTGDKYVMAPGDFDSYGGLTIKQSRPLPITVLMVVRKVHVY